VKEFDYKQRPATPEYHENWDRLFHPSPAENLHAFPMSDDLGPGCTPWLSPLDGDTGLPASLHLTAEEAKEVQRLRSGPADDGLLLAWWGRSSWTWSFLIGFHLLWTAPLVARLRLVRVLIALAWMFHRLSVKCLEIGEAL
jgi:hypothetical protein